MQILVDNKLAILKKDTSFEYIAENFMFTGSDGYSLTITFPLRGCPQNVDIFGHINRKDVAAKKVLFDCEIRHRSLALFGSLAVTDFNEAEVKAQFLEGRSAQNFQSTFDTIYINQLSLGAHTPASPAAITPAAAWDPEGNNMEAVALTWINAQSGTSHNVADCIAGTGTYVWNAATTRLSWLPYLNFIILRIATALGYSCDISQLTENPQYKYLLICNVIPTEGADFNTCLPHWTVEEFFEKLGYFLRGHFSVNHKERHISFTFYRDALSNAGSFLLDKVTDSYSTSVASVSQESIKHVDAVNLMYKEQSFRMWMYYVCDGFLSRCPVKAYDTLDELLPQLARYMYVAEFPVRDSLANSIFYVRDLDLHFILRPVSRFINPNWSGIGGPNIPGNSGTVNPDVPQFGPAYKWFYRVVLTPINDFGPRTVGDSEAVDEIELEFIPANIMYADDVLGDCLYVTINNLSEGAAADVVDQADVWRTYTPDQLLEQFDTAEHAAYFDSISIGYWDGKRRYLPYAPNPIVNNVVISDNFSAYEVLPFSLRLNARSGMESRQPLDIDPTQKCSFSFISDSIPDPTAIFIIAGKRYVCEKLTATFRTEGMSQLIKGVFYPLND